MADYGALRERLQEPDVADQSDQAAADLLNSPGPSIPGIVPPNKLLMWAAATGARARVEAGKTDATIGSICLTVCDLLTTGSIGLDVSDAGNLQMLGILVQSGICTQAQAAALVALGSAPGPSAALTTFGLPVSSNDVHAARS